MIIYISVSMYLYKLKYVFLVLNGALLWREIRVIRFSCIFIVLVCYNAPHQRLVKNSVCAFKRVPSESPTISDSQNLSTSYRSLSLEEEVFDQKHPNFGSTDL